LQVLYTFEEGSGTTVNDVSGVGSPLNLTVNDANAVDWIPGGLNISAPTIASSANEATKLIEAAQASNELTIEAWIRPTHLAQDGPARIVTLSEGQDRRNFTLGQEGATFDFRLRTTTTSDNGLPPLSTAGHCPTSGLYHVVYTRAESGAVKIYVNNTEKVNGNVGGDLSNWEDDYHLALANELSDDRPWLGAYYLVALYSQALGPDEVSQNFNAGPHDETLPCPVVPAFPGAEGFGSQTAGGRGGQVIEVTNLNDDGPGSLRAALEAEGGPRIVVFRVGGTIELQSSLRIENPYITIAGQSAPGEGITLKNAPSNTDPALRVETHDVIIRYIRSRPGASTELSSSLDAFLISNGHNIIVDHASFSWATDENVDVEDNAHDITIQWSIISEGLYDSTHEENLHSMGMRLGGENSERISIHHNLFAHNNSRNPRINNDGIIDVVNNVVYNPGFLGEEGGWGASHIKDDFGSNLVNYVGNYYKRGVNSLEDFYVSAEDDVEIYVQGNITPARPDDDLDEAIGVVRPDDLSKVVQDRHPAPPISTTSAFDAWDQVLAGAGASLPARDAVDERIVQDAIQGTGNVIDDPAEVGGWPDLDPGTPPADSDHDGMPDDWENLYGFNPDEPTDGLGDADGDGYTNVEEYLNGTNPTS
jgi:pectate lyase